MNASVIGEQRSVEERRVTLSQQARDMNWLISAFTERVPGVAHAVVVSSDGLLVAVEDVGRATRHAHQAGRDRRQLVGAVAG